MCGVNAKYASSSGSNKLNSPFSSSAERPPTPNHHQQFASIFIHLYMHQNHKCPSANRAFLRCVRDYWRKITAQLIVLPGLYVDVIREILFQ